MSGPNMIDATNRAPHAQHAPHALGVLALTLLGTLLGSGCSRHVYSPPARMLPIEDALGPSAGGVNLGVQGSGSGTVFGPTIAAAGLHVDVGVSDRIDLVGEGTFMNLDGSGDQPIDSPRTDGAAGRAGLRFTLSETQRKPGDTPPLLLGLALTGGFGGGATAVGTHVSPDLGLSFSMRTPTGFDLSTGVRTWTSVPILRRTFAWTEDERSNEAATTFGAGFTIQGAVPLGFDPTRRGEPRFRALVGLGIAYIGDGTEEATFMQLGGALEARLD